MSPEEFWERIRENNIERAKSDVKAWSDMAKTRKDFLNKMMDADKAIEDLFSFLMMKYPDDFVVLRADLKKVMEYTQWSLKECRENAVWAKKRLEGSLDITTDLHEPELP